MPQGPFSVQIQLVTTLWSQWFHRGSLVFPLENQSCLLHAFH